MTLYFAYGSNMAVVPMASRCPGAVALGGAILRGYDFFIMGNRYGSIRPVPGSNVHGVLWRITPRDLVALDAYESMATGLYRHETLPVMHQGKAATALVYVGVETRDGQPLPGYMELVIAAAREADFPSDYIAQLSRWLPSRPAGAGETPGETS